MSAKHHNAAPSPRLGAAWIRKRSALGLKTSHKETLHLLPFGETASLSRSPKLRYRAPFIERSNSRSGATSLGPELGRQRELRLGPLPPHRTS